ncbi:hypothetical protein C8R45DRAFT_189768 [Mycena sanguinolenta]|nr:hypothetical protein C8R45DRAFT_189768 [Mycena sanguinolenta]
MGLPALALSSPGTDGRTLFRARRPWAWDTCARTSFLEICSNLLAAVAFPARHSQSLDSSTDCATLHSDGHTRRPSFDMIGYIDTFKPATRASSSSCQSRQALSTSARLTCPPALPAPSASGASPLIMTSPYPRAQDLARAVGCFASAMSSSFGISPLRRLGFSPLLCRRPHPPSPSAPPRALEALASFMVFRAMVQTLAARLLIQMAPRPARSRRSSSCDLYKPRFESPCSHAVRIRRGSVASAGTCSCPCGASGRNGRILPSLAAPRLPDPSSSPRSCSTPQTGSGLIAVCLCLAVGSSIRRPNGHYSLFHSSRPYPSCYAGVLRSMMLLSATDLAMIWVKASNGLFRLWRACSN